MANLPREVVEIVEGERDEVGQGFLVRRTLPLNQKRGVDPFLLLDHMGPVRHPAGKRVGVGDHPHRGFETVTIVLEGGVEHRDSQGNHGKLSQGGIQWMTAASGIIHSEFIPQDIVDSGNPLHFLQLWVNLPAKHKMDFPRYQDLASDLIPIWKNEQGIELKVYAGQWKDLKSPVKTHTPISLFLLRVPTSQEFVLPYPENFSAFVHAVSGSFALGQNASHLKAHQTAVLTDSGDKILIKNTANEDAQLLLAGGLPIQEPVAFGGPFVMNSPQEIRQAMLDYHSGNFIREE